jgi:transcriptional regulator with XRE-family HTH domain
MSQAETHTDTEDDSSTLKIGEVIRKLRQRKGISLSQLAVQAGVSKSNLSKIENCVISPTFDTIDRVAKGLGVASASLLSAQSAVQSQPSFTDKGAGLRSESDKYGFEYLFSDMDNRRMVPLIATVKPQETEEFPASSSHGGEEFFFVLEGDITFHCDDQPPREMSVGDAVYFNSKLRHLVRNRNGSEARLLWVWLA